MILATLVFRWKDILKVLLIVFRHECIYSMMFERIKVIVSLRCSRIPISSCFRELSWQEQAYFCDADLQHAMLQSYQQPARIQQMDVKT